MIRLSVRTSAGRYEVLVGEGLLADLGGALRGAGLTARTLIADAAVFPLHGDEARRLVSTVIEVPPGEGSKSLPEAERLWSSLLETGHGRSDAIVALGGGVTGDLAGFVAATLHRGVPFVQAPTTLLAQVDSSVGGKVAIDHPLGKNLIGAFHQPRLVVADTATLATLPARERWSGLAEIVKAALLGDAALFDLLERDLEAIAAAPTADVVARSIAIKARIVEQDEREGGLRRVLNLGHTVGHALELLANPPGFADAVLTHGEAVAYGMRAALRLSRRHAGLAGKDERRALDLLARFPLPKLPALDRDALLAAMGRDKKREGAAVHSVVVPALGSATTLPAGGDLLREAIDLALDAP